MNMKKWIPILIGITIIAFGTGIFSLLYNDNFTTSNVFRNGIIQVKSNGDNVIIGKNGIVVKDGNSNIRIGWDGIDVRDGDEHVTIGWGGITVTEGGETKFNLGNPNRWGPNKWNKLNSYEVEEEKYLDIEEIDSIVIDSQFVDIKIFTEDRADIRVKYYGVMKSNVVPELNISKRDQDILITLDNPKSNYSVTESDVVLEIFVPLNYKKNISSNTGSADIYMANFIGDNISLYTTSGDIKIDKTKTNSIKLASMSGDIESKGSAGVFDIITSSGDVDLSLEESKGDIKITTSSGDVDINYWAAVDYNITSISSSGDLYFNGSNVIKKDNKGMIELVLGKGGNNLDIITSSGDIYLNNK